MAFLVRRKGHSCEPSSQLISFADYGFATVTGFTLFAKNSPPDYFLNAKTLSGFESLQPEIIKTRNILKDIPHFWYAGRDSNPRPTGS